MKPFVKSGLLVGVIALVIVVPVSVLMGLCGPFVTLIAGIFAGFLCAYNSPAMTRTEGAKAGALAGAVAGGLALIGQIIGGVLILGYTHLSGNNPSLNQVLNSSSPTIGLIAYYASGLGVGLCFGVIGVILGALAGAGGGAVGVRQPTAAAPTANPPV